MFLSREIALQIRCFFPGKESVDREGNFTDKLLCSFLDPLSGSKVDASEAKITA